MNLKNEPIWRPVSGVPRMKLSSNIYSWLVEPKSMTNRLNKHCKNFHVEVIDQSWRLPFASERRALSLKQRQLAVIREVKLICDGKPWMFARSIIPSYTVTGKYKQLHGLGTTPLGHLLFIDPTMQRSPFEIAVIKTGDYFFEKSTVNQNEMLWGRRSIFYLSNKPLLLTEVFTADFPFR